MGFQTEFRSERLFFEQLTSLSSTLLLLLDQSIQLAARIVDILPD
jgi:hypothetical protein